MSFPFWVVVKAGQNVYDAIKAGEWYVSEIAAEATADQFRHMTKEQYYVIGNDLEQQPLDKVTNNPLGKPASTIKKEVAIKDMVTGESGYAVPWALSYTKKGKPYLRMGYTVQEAPGGTVQMLVQKLGQDWYQVSTRYEYPYSYEHDKSDPNPAWDVCYNLNLI